MRVRVRNKVFVVFGLALSSVSLAHHTSEHSIEQRIKPVGQVRVGAASTAIVGDATGNVGQAKYQKHCFACHGTGVAGSPKTKADWDKRVGKGLQVLVTNAVKGINAMPPKGTCMDCTEADIKATIEYMLSQAK